MKKLLLMLFIASPLLSKSQTTDSLQAIISNFKVENKAVTYVSIHGLNGVAKEDIKKMMLRKLASDPMLTISQSIAIDDQIDGSFKDLTVDYKKYGFSYFNIASWVLHPANGSFTIQFKDDKYRIIIKGMKFVVQRNMVFDFNSDFSDREGNLASSQKLNMRRSYYALGMTFEDLFKINKLKKEDW